MNQFDTLLEAVQFAMKFCSDWNFAYSNEIYNSGTLPSIAEIHDAENPTDEDSFYFVSISGAIGFTQDGGENIEWLFIPQNNKGEVLPSSLSITVKAKFCRKCGGPVEIGANFCGGCGSKI